MEKTRDRAVYVTTALSIWGIGLTVSNPWLVGWLWLSAAGALAFAVKPQWATIRLWGKKESTPGASSPEILPVPAREAEGTSGRSPDKGPLFDFEDTDAQMTDTDTSGDRPAVRSKGGKFTSKRWRHDQ
jgi:hypothetical protein